jgi:hypothetical protein
MPCGAGVSSTSRSLALTWCTPAANSTTSRGARAQVRREKVLGVLLSVYDLLDMHHGLQLEIKLRPWVRA